MLKRDMKKSFASRFIIQYDVLLKYFLGLNKNYKCHIAGVALGSSNVFEVQSHKIYDMLYKLLSSQQLKCQLFQK